MKLRLVCGASSTASSNSIVPLAVSMKTCGEYVGDEQRGIVVRRDGASRRRPNRILMVALRVELGEELGGAHANRPVLVGQRGLQRLGWPPPDRTRQRVERAPARV